MMAPIAMMKDSQKLIVSNIYTDGSAETDGKVLYSMDGGYTFRECSGITASTDIRGICRGINGMYVAVAYTFIISGIPRFFSSPDGITWTERTCPAGANNWSHVIYGGGQFVAVHETNNSTPKYATSPDGITWTAVNASGGRPTFVVYGGGQYVAVGNIGGTNGCQTSPDGVTWTARSIAAPTISRSVAYGGTSSLYVVVGNTAIDNYATSPDGITWTQRTLPVANQQANIAFGAGLFVLFTTATTSVTSPDGITWTTRTLPTISAFTFWAELRFQDDMFVAVTRYSSASPDEGILMTSFDGINWTVKVSGAGTNLNGTSTVG